MAALASLLEGLRDNTSSQLRLSLEVHSDLPVLLDVLRANTSVKEVNLDIYESFRHRPDAGEEVMEIFAALSALPNLQRLWVDSGQEGSPFYTLSVQILTLVLRQAPRLSRFALYDIELAAGGVADITQLEAAVRDHTSLQNFGLVGCRLAEDTIVLSAADTAAALAQQAGDEAAAAVVVAESKSEVTPVAPHAVEFAASTCYALNGLVQHALTNCAWVELRGQEHEALGELTPTALGSLCDSNKLIRLTLEYFDLKDDHIAAMSRALATSATLQELQFSCELGRVGCTAIGQLLAVNTSLTNLTLQLNELKMNDNLVIETQRPQGNDRNSSQPDSTSSRKDPSLRIALALETNNCLQYFCLSGYAKISRHSRESFAVLLRENMTLLNCELDLQNSPRLPDNLHQEANMFLKLNELGRKKLLQGCCSNDDHNPLLLQDDSSPQKWVQVLWEVRHDLDALFYLLSLNPTLCDNTDGPRIAEKRGSVPTYSDLSHLQYKYLLS